MSEVLKSIIKGTRDYLFKEEIFPGDFVEDDYIIRPDGNISVGYEIEYPVVESLSEEEIYSLQTQLENSLSSLPIGTVVHFQTQYFWKEATSLDLNNIDDDFLVNTMVSHVQNRPVSYAKSRMYICFNLNHQAEKNPTNTLFANFRAIKNNLSNIERDKLKVRNLIQSFQSQFSNVNGVTIKRLSTEELEQEKVNYYNLSFDENSHSVAKEHYNDKAAYLIGSDKVGFVYLGKTSNILYRSALNDRRVRTFMAWPLGFTIDFPHIVNMTIRIEGEALLSELDKTVKTRNALGSLTQQLDAVASEDVSNFTREIRAFGKTVVKMHSNIMTWASDYDTLNYRQNQLSAAYSKMNESVAMIPALNTGNFYYACSPGYALDITNTLVMSLEDAILHYDFSKETVSDQKGVLLCTRNGEPTIVDMWPDWLDNKHKVVVGPSGSGKSFTMCDFVLQGVAAGETIIIFDVGGSYKNLFSFYKDSKYIEANNSQGFSFNPFLTNKDERGNYIIDSETMVFLLAQLETILKRTEKGEGLSKEEESIFENWIKGYYENINKTKKVKPRFDNFVAYVLEEYKANSHKEEMRFIDITSFKLLVKKYLPGGIYGNLINSDDNMALSDRRLICIDLLGVQEDPLSYPIILLNMIKLVVDKMKSNPDSRKQLILDEAWSMMKGRMAVFLEGAYRTLRKLNGAVCIITQTIIELRDSPIGAIVDANASIKILLDHSKAQAMIPETKKFFKLTDLGEELLRSIRRESTWREILLIRGTILQVLRVDIGAYASAAFSSNSADKARIQKLIEVGGPEYAVKQFVEDKMKAL